MTELAFNRLRIVDFKAIDELTLDLSAFGPGCHSIRGRNLMHPRLGSNGASKSSLWDALTYVLYGRTPRGLRSSDLIPWHTPDANPGVALFCSVDGEPHVIARNANPHQLRLDRNVVTQERVDQLIRLPYDVYINTVCMAQARPLFLDLSPADKLDLMVKVLDLNRFERYASTALAIADAAAKEQITLKLQTSGLEGRVSEASAQLARLQSLAAGFEQEKKGKLGEATREDNEARLALSIAEVEFDKAERDVKKAEEVLQQATVAYDTAFDRLTEAKQVDARLNVYREQLVALGKLKGRCPTCLQPIHERHLQACRAELHGKLKGAPVLTGLVKEMETAFGLMQSARPVAKQAHDKHQRLHERCLSLRNRCAMAANNLRLAKAMVNPHAHDLNVVRQRLADLKRQLNEVTTARVVLEMQRLHVEPWVPGFRDMRLMIVEEVLQTLSTLTTSYASELGLDCQAIFSVERESKSGSPIRGINLTVDGINRFESWSGGEGQRLRLAASLALSSTLLAEAGISIPMLIFDEPSAHLSPEGLKELVGFLAQHATSSGQSIFITDQRQLSGASSTVTVLRDKDGVRLQ